MNGYRRRESTRTPGVRHILVLLLTVVPLPSLVLAEIPFLEIRHRVLVLQSYHPGYTWNDSLRSAITSTLLTDDDTVPEIDISVEFMDAQHGFTENTFELLDALYRDRYTRHGVTFDVIIVTDDPALDFLQERGEGIFGRVPVVFCGINNLDPSRLEGYPHYTGVNEVIDLPGTIDMALTLRPRARRLAIVSDASFTGRINTAIYRAFRRHYRDRVDFVELFELEPEAVAARLGELERTDAVISLSYFVTPDGQRLSVERSFAFLVAASAAPVFSLWDFALGTGAVGGSVVSATEQGRTAAEMALRILDGTPVEAIPVRLRSPNLLMADYRALREHRIPIQALPDGTVVTGRPVTPWYVYWGWIIGLFVFIVLQSTLIVALFSSRRRLKRSQEQLAQSLEERDVLLREIHHRVKNNLQVIASLINITVYGKENVEDALRDVQQRVIAMSHIHEQLYQTGQFAHINLEHYVRDVVSHLATAYESGYRAPDVIIDVGRIPLDLDKAVPFGLILTELVTNSIKHAFRSTTTETIGPVIMVEVRREEETVLLRVSDNGVGLPADMEITTAGGTGMILVRSLTGQIGGTITPARCEPIPAGVVTDTSSGTTIEIRFPIHR